MFRKGNKTDKWHRGEERNCWSELANHNRHRKQCWGIENGEKTRKTFPDREETLTCPSFVSLQQMSEGSQKLPARNFRTIPVMVDDN